jgi:hypothetical protein
MLRQQRTNSRKGKLGTVSLIHVVNSGTCIQEAASTARFTRLAASMFKVVNSRAAEHA